jgi:hypothetical protein
MTTFLEAQAEAIVGQSITLTATFDPAIPYLIQNSPDSLLFLARAPLTFSAGDGQQQIVEATNFIPNGLTSMSATFTYSAPGDYTAQVSGTVFYGLSQCPDRVCGVVPGTGQGHFSPFADTHILVGVPEPGASALFLVGALLLLSIERGWWRPQFRHNHAV